HARVEFEDARFVVGVLPHLLEGGPPAVLRVLALVQTRLRVPSAEEHDSLRPLAAGRSDRPNVARERILLQVKEALCQRVRPAPGDPATGQLLNDARIREHLTTIRELRPSKVALLAHQSRPGKDDFTTLEAHAERIGALLGRPVRYVSSLFGRPAIEAIDAMQVGDVIVLENTRFYAEEEALADAKLEKMAKTHIVQRLAPHAEYFILDAFA